jgi:glycosyltransferase involved in cell wall biosynthesis
LALDAVGRRRVQILLSTGAINGTFQHALMLSRACLRLGHDVTLVDVRPDGWAAGPARTRHGDDGIAYQLATVAELSPASLDIVVGLWDEQTIQAARHLSRRDTRLILAPTIYWDHALPRDLPKEAEALWYVSWDQASRDRESWPAAERVEVVRCAVDTERFRPSGRAATGSPWQLGRHSRDVAAKFSPEIAEYLRRVGTHHDVHFSMLGAARTMCELRDDRVRLYGEGELPPEVFLAGCDLWVFAHAPYWRETACVAMLEAMASGLPVVVDNLGGMREYVQHGRTGFLCNGLEEFVSATSLLFEVPGLRGEMGAQARAYVEQHHSIVALTERLRPLVAAPSSPAM